MFSATIKVQDRLAVLLNKSSGPEPHQRLLGLLQQSDMPDRLARFYRFAGIDRAGQNRNLFFVAILFSSLLTLALLTQIWLIVLVAAVVAAVNFALIANRAQSRARQFEGDYTAMLLSLASSVKTGQDPLLALAGSWRLFKENSEMRLQLYRFSQLLEAGATEEQALAAFADTINMPDLRLFRLAFSMARREGSSLSECLQRLARTTRQRQSFRRKISSAVALQKLSANGIAVCAGLIFMIQYNANPAGMLEAWQDPRGKAAFCLGFVLLLSGLFFLRRVGRHLEN